MVKKRSHAGFTKSLKSFFIVLGIAGLAACGGGGDKGGGDKDDNDYDDGGGGSSSVGSMKVQLSGAVAVLAQDETVEEVDKPYQKVSSKTGKPLFTYKITNQGWTEEALASMKAARGKGMLAGAETSDSTDTNATNLLAVNSDGSTSLAIDADAPVKVMYSVTDPAGEYVYLALDTGWWGGGDGNNYEEFIAASNCAFYRVKLADDTLECVAEGKLIQDMSQDYMQRVSGNQKPIQFDENSNVYFAATDFEQQCDEWDNDGDGTIDDSWCYLDFSSWNPTVNRFDPETGTVENITQDTDHVEFFVVLDDGNIVFRSWNESTGSSSLDMWRAETGSVITLNSDSGVDFFTVDTSNTVMWGGWSEDGIQFARPREPNAAYTASLNTSLFSQGGSASGGWTAPSPKRVMVADDGRLYGVFEGGSDSYDESTEEWTWESKLTVYQVLPYDGVPKAQLTLPDNSSWWDWMNETSFQVAKGYLFYVEQVEDPFYSEMDVIRMVRLSDRTTTSLFDVTTEELDNGASYYDIYSWRLSGDELHFSGLDKQSNNVVNGTIDVPALRADPTNSEDYLTITEIASAQGAVAKIRDIEVLKPQQSEYEAGTPSVDEFHFNQENLYSASIDFTKYMDHDSVETNLSFEDVTNGTGEIDYLPIWIYKTLHLVPDTDGFAEGGTQPLQGDTTYKLSVPANTLDASDVQTDVTEEESITMRPDDGWYPGTTTATNADVSAGGAAKYAGPSEDWDMESYNLGVDASGNVRLEFSAKNLGWAGANVMLWNPTRFSTDDYTGDGVEANIRLEHWSSVEYARTESTSTIKYGEWEDGETPDVFNGTWQRYRIDFYGTNLKVYLSEDGSTFDEVTELSITDLRDRSETTGEGQQLLLRVQEPLLLDDLRVVNLVDDGNGNWSEGTTASLDEDFGDGGSAGLDAFNGDADDGKGFDEDVESDTTNYGDLANWW